MAVAADPSPRKGNSLWQSHLWLLLEYTCIGVVVAPKRVWYRHQSQREQWVGLLIEYISYKYLIKDNMTPSALWQKLASQSRSCDFCEKYSWNCTWKDNMTWRANQKWWLPKPKPVQFHHCCIAWSSSATTVVTIANRPSSTTTVKGGLKSCQKKDHRQRLDKLKAEEQNRFYIPEHGSELPGGSRPGVNACMEGNTACFLHLDLMTMTR